MQEIKRKYFDITNLVQNEFDRNLQKYGDKMQCRRGCSQCCHQIFRITLLDARIIEEHMRSLPLDAAEVLRAKAQNYLEVMDKVISDEEFSERPKIACPALGEEGECTIYQARPVICRRFGMPMYDYKKPEKIHACELNFKQGEEITDDELIPNQTAIGMKWDELKEEFNSVQNSNGKNFTTIAEAILSGSKPYPFNRGQLPSK